MSRCPVCGARFTSPEECYEHIAENHAVEVRQADSEGGYVEPEEVPG